MPNVTDFPSNNIRVRLGKKATPFVLEASALIHSTFEEHDVPLPDRALMVACQEKNPATFVIVQPRGENRVCCVVEMYLLRKRALDALLSGRMSETDIRIDDVVPLGESVTGGLYIAITGPRVSPNKGNGLNILAAIDGAIEVLGQCYVREPGSSVNIYALDATQEGLELLTLVFGKLFKPIYSMNVQRRQRGLKEQAWRGVYNAKIGTAFRDRWRIPRLRFPLVQEW